LNVAEFSATGVREIGLDDQVRHEGLARRRVETR